MAEMENRFVSLLFTSPLSWFPILKSSKTQKKKNTQIAPHKNSFKGLQRPSKPSNSLCKGRSRDTVLRLDAVILIGLSGPPFQATPQHLTWTPLWMSSLCKLLALQEAQLLSLQQKLKKKKTQKLIRSAATLGASPSGVSGEITPILATAVSLLGFHCQTP